MTIWTSSPSATRASILLEEVQELGRPVSDLQHLPMTKPDAISSAATSEVVAVPHVIGCVRRSGTPGFMSAKPAALDRAPGSSAFLVNAKDKRPVGRREVKADDIAHLVDEQRIGRQLESLACGCRPNATHIRRIVACEKPAWPRIERIASASRRQAWCAMSARSRRQPDRRRWFEGGPKGEASSSRPSLRSFKKRRRHLPTVCSRPSSAPTSTSWLSRLHIAE